MALIYHNITPPEYFVGVHRTLARQCFRGRRELDAYADRCDLALGDSEFNRQDLEALGLPAHRRAAGRPRFLAPRSAAELARRRASSTTTWTNILFVGRVIANKKIEDLIRFFHAYHTRLQPAVAAAPRRRPQHASSATSRRCTSSSATLGARPRPLRRPRVGRGAGGLLRHRRPVPLRQRARRLLRARSSRRSTSRCRCWPTPPRPCRPRWTARACSTTTRIRSHVAALMDAILSNAALQDAHRRRPARGGRPAAGEGLRRHAARLRRSRSCRPARRRAARSPSTSGTSSTPRRSSRSCGCTGRRSTRRCRRTGA